MLMAKMGISACVLAHVTVAAPKIATLRWQFEPVSSAGLVIAAGLYFAGLRAFWNSADGRRRGILPREAWFFAAGCLTLAIALVSPLHALGGELFAAHMTQHELLMLIAAPLLVLSRPMVVFLKALPRGAAHALGHFSRRPAFRAFWLWLSAPLTAWFIHGAVLWIWHAPALFELTLKNEFVHALQHISFLGSALLFWWALAAPGESRAGYGGAILYLFTTALHTGFLGGLLTFTRTSWYPSYRATAPLWGFTALEDQQLGGLIMWIPGGLVYVFAALALFAAWLREAERRSVADRYYAAPPALSPEGPR
jgi:putative membrane protein